MSGALRCISHHAKRKRAPSCQDADARTLFRLPVDATHHNRRERRFWAALKGHALARPKNDQIDLSGPLFTCFQMARGSAMSHSLAACVRSDSHRHSTCWFTSYQEEAPLATHLVAAQTVSRAGRDSQRARSKMTRGPDYTLTCGPRFRPGNRPQNWVPKGEARQLGVTLCPLFWVPFSGLGEKTARGTSCHTNSAPSLDPTGMPATPHAQPHCAACSLPTHPPHQLGLEMWTLGSPATLTSPLLRPTCKAILHTAMIRGSRPARTGTAGGSRFGDCSTHRDCMKRNM
jgi:hypothetical protein